MFTVQQPFNFILIDKVNEVVKNTEYSQSYKGKEGALTGAKTFIHASIFTKAVLQCFHVRIYLCAFNSIQSWIAWNTWMTLYSHTGEHFYTVRQ